MKIEKNKKRFLINFKEKFQIYKMKKLLMIFIIFFSVKNLHYYFEKMTVRY